MISLLTTILLLSFLPKTNLAFAVSCEDQCRKYENAARQRDQECPKSQDPTLCQQKFLNQWNEVGAACLQRDLAHKTKSQQTVTAAAYTAAGVVCGISCATQFTGATLVSQAACNYSGLGAAATEVGSALLMIRDGDASEDLKSELKSKRKETVKQAANTAITGAGTVMSASMIRSVIRNKVTAKLTNSCVAAVFLGVVAKNKWENGNSSRHLEDDACKRAVRYVGLGAAEAGSLSAPATLAQAQRSTASSGGRTQVSSSAKPEEDWSIEESSPFPGGRLQAALAGPEGEFLGSIPNRENLLEEFKSATGMGVGDVTRQLESGVSPTSFLSSIEGLPDGMLDAVQELETMMDKGELVFDGSGVEGTTAVAAASGPAKGGAKEEKPEVSFNFGLKGKAPQGDSKEVQFEKMSEPKRILAGGDIWHSGFSGTIFEIVTERIDQSKNQVDQLEWASPLNRALMGLPVKKEPRK